MQLKNLKYPSPKLMPLERQYNKQGERGRCWHAFRSPKYFPLLTLINWTRSGRVQLWKPHGTPSIYEQMNKGNLQVSAMSSIKRRIKFCQSKQYEQTA